MGLIGAFADNDTELVPERVGCRFHDRGVPAADEHGGNGRHIERKSRGVPSLDSTCVRHGKTLSSRDAAGLDIRYSAPRSIWR